MKQLSNLAKNIAISAPANEGITFTPEFTSAIKKLNANFTNSNTEVKYRPAE